MWTPVRAEAAHPARTRRGTCSHHALLHLQRHQSSITPSESPISLTEHLDGTGSAPCICKCMRKLCRRELLLARSTRGVQLPHLGSTVKDVRIALDQACAVRGDLTNREAGSIARDAVQAVSVRRRRSRDVVEPSRDAAVQACEAGEVGEEACRLEALHFPVLDRFAMEICSRVRRVKLGWQQ
jgi:hypothetical protein